MKYVDRIFKTVAKPEGSSTHRLGNVTITSPSFDLDEAPVAITCGTTAYRVIDGRLYLPLPPPRYGGWSESVNQQAMVNRMLVTELSNDGYRDLKARMDKESDIDLTETDRGQLLRERARAYPIIDGVQHIPVPGPLIDVNVRPGVPERDETGRPLPAPYVTNVIWKDHEQADYFSGALFTLDAMEQALDFANSLESDDASGIPAISKLRSNVQLILPYEPANISDIQIWVMACAQLHTATYTSIHDFGRDGVMAMMNLRRDLSARMGGGVDAFLDRILTLGNEREYAAFLRPFDTVGLEDTLGPVLDHLAARKEADGAKTPPLQVERKLLALLRPAYSIPGPILDSEELAALASFHGMKP